MEYTLDGTLECKNTAELEEAFAKADYNEEWRNIKLSGKLYTPRISLNFRSGRLSIQPAGHMTCSPVIDLGGKTRLACLGPGAEVEIRGIIVRNGHDVDDNRRQMATSAHGGGRGGAILNEGGLLKLIDCAFENCISGHHGRGGAICSTRSPRTPLKAVNIDHCGGKGGSTVAEGCSFVGNLAGGFGGAIFCGDGGFLSLSHCEFVANAARSDGAGGAVYSSGTTRIDGCKFIKNRSCGPYGGGAVYSVDDTVVEGSLFEANEGSGARGVALLLREGMSRQRGNFNDVGGGQTAALRKVAKPVSEDIWHLVDFRNQ